MTPDFSPRQTLERTLRGWPIIAALMLAGVLLGWGFSLLSAPIYEAQAEILTGVNSAQVGSVDDEELDLIINTAGDVMDSTLVRQAVLDAAAARGWPLELTAFSGPLTLERKAQSWVFRVQDEDPQRAADLANLWADEALAALDEAAQSARLAEAEQRALDSLVTCWQYNVSQPQGSAACAPLTASELQDQIVELNTAVQDARAEAQGLFPGINYALNQEASRPTRPLHYDRTNLMLAGAGLGLLIALGLLFQSWRPRRV